MQKKDSHVLVCKQCGHVVKPYFSHDFQPKKCPKCNGEFERQTKEEVITK